MSYERITHLAVVETSAPDALSLALDALLLDAEARRLAPKTLLYCRQQLAPFLAYLQENGVTTPEALTANHIRAYLASFSAVG